jgi:hypothetical protein
MIEKTVNAPTKPARSPVERAIVWGVIVVGLVVVAMEASAYFAAENARKALHAKIDAVESGTSTIGVTQEDVEKVVAGRKPVSSEKLTSGETAMMAARLDIYEFKGLVRSRKLYVYYGIEGKSTDGKTQQAEVMDVLTSPAETQEAALAKLPKAEPSTQSTDGTAPPPGGPMGPGPMSAGAGPMGGVGPMGSGASPMGGGRRRRGGEAGGAAGGAGRPAGEDTPKTDAPAEKKEDATPAVTAEEPKKEEPKADEPKNEAPKAEETKTEEPKKSE